jgi:hypothetical protein
MGVYDYYRDKKVVGVFVRFRLRRFMDTINKKILVGVLAQEN